MISNPFASDIFPDGFPLAGEDGMAVATALEELEALLQEVSLPARRQEAGRVVQLRAPRAGYGKSHLLAKLRERLRGKALVLKVDFDPDKDFRWSGLFWEILEKFHSAPGEQLGVTLLDELGRRTFARLNTRMIRQGRIPCADPESAVAAMEERAVELYDLANQRQPVGRWFTEHFERLLSGISQELAKDVGISESAAANWLRILCSYTQGVADSSPTRFENLRWAAHQGHSAPVLAGGMQMVQVPDSSDAYFKDRLAEFGRIATLWRPLVFIFDDLDTLHGSADQTMRVATIMSELRRLLPRTLVVCSVNQDLWTHAFQKFIPSALEDRLSSTQVTLGSQSREDAEALIQHRLNNAHVPSSLVEEFQRLLNLPDVFHREPQRISSPRSLLRLAARVWDAMMMRKQYQVSPESDGNHGTGGGLGIGLGGGGGSKGLMPGATLPQFKEALGKMSGIAKTESNVLTADGGFLKIDLPEKGSTARVDPPAIKPALSEPKPPQVQENAWKKCQQLRAKLADSDSLKIDPDLFSHLLEAGGRHIALVQAQHVAVPSSPGPGALVWKTPDGEIYFGTESYGDKLYWRALLQHVKDKSLESTEYGKQVWMVVFLPVEANSVLEDWLGSPELVTEAKAYVHELKLDHAELASIYAVDEVLHESEHSTGNLPPPAEVFGMLSPLVDVFWRRVTKAWG